MIMLRYPSKTLTISEKFDKNDGLAKPELKQYARPN